MCYQINCLPINNPERELCQQDLTKPEIFFLPTFPSPVSRIKIKARQTRLLNWTAAMASKTWKRRLPRGSFPSPLEPMETRKIQTQVRRQGQAFYLGIVGNRKKGAVLEKCCMELFCLHWSVLLWTIRELENTNMAPIHRELLDIVGQGGVW